MNFQKDSEAVGMAMMDKHLMLVAVEVVAAVVSTIMDLSLDHNPQYIITSLVLLLLMVKLLLDTTVVMVSHQDQFVSLAILHHQRRTEVSDP